MEIRTATAADIPLLCVLLKELFAQEAEFAPNIGKQKIGLQMIIENPEVGYILIAEQSDKIIGMVNLLFTVSTALGSKVTILEDMIVSSEFRGQGIGAMLLESAKTLSAKSGCKRMTLLTDVDNDGAHRFYCRNGFKQSDMVTFRYNL